MSDATIVWRRSHVLDDHARGAIRGRELATPQVTVAAPKPLKPRSELERARARRLQHALDQPAFRLLLT